MSLYSHWNFNENDATKVVDYSTNARDATVITGLTIVAGELGYAGSLNGTTSKLNFGNIADFGGTAVLFLFAKISRAATQAHVIFKKTGQFEVSISATNKVVFKANAGAAETTLTSIGSIELTTYTTIACVYDGVKMYIYIAGVEDTNVAKTGNLVASSNDLLIGSDNTNFFSGKIEVAEIRNDAPNAASVLAKHNAPTGIKYETNKDHNLELGDLLTDDPYNVAAITPTRMVVTYKESTLIFHAIPILNTLTMGNIPIRRGNVNNIARDWIFENKIISDKPYIYAKTALKNFTATTPAASSILDFSGVKDRGVLIPSLTLVQRDAIATPATGLLIFKNNDTVGFDYYNGSAWKSLRDHSNMVNLTVDDHSQYALLAGRSGGQTFISGTGVTDKLILRATSGVGIAGADIIFQVGNNGATEAMRILNSGVVLVGSTTSYNDAYKHQVHGHGLFRVTGGLTTGFTQIDIDQPEGVVFAGDGFSLIALGSAFSGVGAVSPDSAFFGANAGLSNGIGFAATHPTATQRFYTGGTGVANERMRILANGNVAIGLTAATAILHLKAGTATANTAPLKFDSAIALLTTPEAGAVEFLTDKYYATITTSAARKEFTLNDIALTSGRVPFATTNGRLTDDAGFTFDLATLSIKSSSALNLLLNTSRAAADARNWGIGGNQALEGDFVIQQSTSNSNAPSVNRFYISLAGVVSNGTYAFALNDIALTSGRVPFATTGGRLTDDADFTFATDTLTVTKIAATNFTGNITLSDAVNIVTSSTGGTGSKIGTGTTQKIGFWNATPIVQPAGVADADGTLASATAQLNALISRIEATGLIATI